MGDHRSSDAGLLETLAAEDETLRAGNRKSSGTNSNEWLVNVADDVVVPMITSEVVEALRAGRLTNRSLVWRIGMHDWSALAEVPQLRLAAGPSALPPAASTPGPVIHKSPLPPEQRRRTTLPFGLAAVPKPKDDSGALAVYDRPAASLTFADSVRAEWQGNGRNGTPAQAPSAPVPPVPPVPPATSASPSRPRHSPVPPVASRLPQRALRSVPTNTLAPTTAEAEQVALPRAPHQWGDLSVVLASELRAEKKATKRLVLWAGAGSAVAASLFTFWVARSVVPSAAPVAPAAAPQTMAQPVVAPPPEPAHVAPLAPPVLSAAPAVVVHVKPAVPVVVRPRLVARPKPKPVAPAPDVDGASVAPQDGSAADKPSLAAALPLAAPDAQPTPAPSSSVAPAASAAPEAPSSPPAAPVLSSSTPGF